MLRRKTVLGVLLPALTTTELSQSRWRVILLTLMRLLTKRTTPSLSWWLTFARESVSRSSCGKLTSLCITPVALTTGLLAAFCYLFYTVYPDKLYDSFGILTIAAWGQLISGLSFTFVLGGIHDPFHLTVKAGLFIIASMLCGTLIPFVIYGIGVKIIGGVKASLFVTIEPVASAVMAYFILGIQFTFIDILGFLCIIAAIEIISIISSRENSADNTDKIE